MICHRLVHGCFYLPTIPSLSTCVEPGARWRKHLQFATMCSPDHMPIPLAWYAFTSSLSLQLQTSKRLQVIADSQLARSFTCSRRLSELSFASVYLSIVLQLQILCRQRHCPSPHLSLASDSRTLQKASVFLLLLLASHY